VRRPIGRIAPKLNATGTKQVGTLLAGGHSGKRGAPPLAQGFRWPGVPGLPLPVIQEGGHQVEIENAMIRVLQTELRPHLPVLHASNHHGFKNQ
jgi:hypothetical protein